MLKAVGSLLVVTFLGVSTLYARWDKVLSTRDSIWIGRTLEIRSGHFFDESVGMVGAGSSTGVPVIFLTTDGGTSWTQASTPVNGNGVVSSFFFRDRFNGYATVHKTSFPSSSIWRTSDGGSTWIDETRTRTDFEHSCIYETSRVLIVTSWDRTGGKGGFSVDGGLTWNEVFSNAADHSSNGIGFVDDLHGLVTMGPASNQPTGNNAYITSDGGLTWKKTREFNEAWSVFARKGTSTFFLAPEGDIAGSTGDRNIMRSDDYGQTFGVVHQFPTGIQLAGHIDGAGRTLYVQTRRQSTVQGLFRSDDLGTTWKNVGGPSNVEDSRFVVTGCLGEIVYAFDNNGNVWKTSDGGDGTLDPSLSILSLSEDTLHLSTFFCSPVSAVIDLANFSCDTLLVDSINVSGDSLAEFFVGPAPPFILRNMGSANLSVDFIPSQPGFRQILVRIKGRRGPAVIDTFITIVARNQIAPEIQIPPLSSVKAGEELTVPILIKPTTDTFSIDLYRMLLRFDTDVLTPVRLETFGTLSENAVATNLTSAPDGALLTVAPAVTVTERSDLTRPLVNVIMKVNLSRSFSTLITVDSFGTPQLFPRCQNLVLPQSLFTLDPDCGDSILLGYLRTNSLANILSIHPNPSHGDEVTVSFDVREECSLSIDILDLSGKTVKDLRKSMLYRTGRYSEQLAMPLLSGAYYIRLKQEDKVLSMWPITVSK